MVAQTQDSLDQLKTIVPYLVCNDYAESCTQQWVVMPAANKMHFRDLVTISMGGGSCQAAERIVRTAVNPNEPQSIWWCEQTVQNTSAVLRGIAVNIPSTTAGEFQVKVHLVLECIDQSIRQAESTAMSRWICEKEVDFSPETKVLVSRCQHVVNDLVTQFLDLNRQINLEMKEKPTFFIL